MFTSTYTGEGAAAGTLGGMSIWGIVIFVLLILWIFFTQGKENYCNQDARADRIAETAKIEYNNLLETRSAKEEIMSQASLIRNEQQAETIFDLKMNSQTKELQNGQLMIAKDSKIEMLESELKRQKEFFDLTTKVDSLACNTPKIPPFYAQGFVTTGQEIPQDLRRDFGRC